MIVCVESDSSTNLATNDLNKYERNPCFQLVSIDL